MIVDNCLWRDFWGRQPLHLFLMVKHVQLFRSVARVFAIPIWIILLLLVYSTWVWVPIQDPKSKIRNNFSIFGMNPSFPQIYYLDLFGVLKAHTHKYTYSLGTMSRGITQPYQGTNLSTTVTWALLVPWSMLHGVWPFLWEFPFVGHYTLWLFNIAMENGPFIDGLPFLNMVIFHGELLHNQRVILHSWCHGGDDHALCWHFFWYQNCLVVQ